MKTLILKLVLVLSITTFLYSCSSDEDGIYMDSFEDISLNYSPMEYEILELVNNHRESIGLPTLSILNIVSKEAEGHNDYMIQEGKPSHDNFPSRYTSLVSSVEAQEVGENVGYGYRSSESIVNAWIKSDGHRRNIENQEYTDFGISVQIDEDGRNYFTQIFVKR